MPGAQRVDPYLNFRFLVEIEGIQQAGFMECTGLGSQVEVVEYREGGDPATVRKLAGRVSYPDIVLKWGVTDNQDLYQWHLAVIQGNLVRKNGSVILLDSQGNERLRWNFYNAWPSKWVGPSLDARGNEVAIEELTLTCERQEMPSA
jgi:phage tail-like protein